MTITIEEKKLAVALISGGLDSVTLAHYLWHQDYRLLLLSFDYGQKHRKEISFAKACARRLSAEHRLIDLSFLGVHLKGSALTDNRVDVPHGHYHEETMRQTVVPNRNAIMLSIAWGIAVAEQASVVAAAIHAGDHFIYPDCRPEFAATFNYAMRLATDGHRRDELTLYTPYLKKTKAEIVAIGASMSVPFEQTWTCYEGKEEHCGQCGACNERREAFVEAQVADPTIYQIGA